MRWYYSIASSKRFCFWLWHIQSTHWCASNITMRNSFMGANLLVPGHIATASVATRQLFCCHWRKSDWQFVHRWLLLSVQNITNYIESQHTWQFQSRFAKPNIAIHRKRQQCFIGVIACKFAVELMQHEYACSESIRWCWSCNKQTCNYTIIEPFVANASCFCCLSNSSTESLPCVSSLNPASDLIHCSSGLMLLPSRFT